ncbi:MAG: hypothetical protein ACKVWR_08795 [Acidimicrobiales bacterium]
MQLTIIPRWTPGLDDAGFDLLHPYVELVWEPLLGPTCTVILRRVGMRWAEQAEAFKVDAAGFARSLGLGEGLGRNSQLIRSLIRLEQFRLARCAETVVSLPVLVPPVHAYQLERLPFDVRAAHRELVAGRAHASGLAD